MTREELIREIEQLPLAEREAAVEELRRGIQEEIRANGSAESEEQSKRIERKLAAVNRLRGLFKTGAPPPTDEELKEDYANYLMKKYS